jgi:SAM-dependent methyltransferase
MNLILAKLYHAQHQEYQEDIPFWLALAAEQGGPIIEMGCGTGRITKQLLEQGYKVTGVDSDPEMLDFIRLNTEEDENLKLIEADFIEYAGYQGHPLVILPCNTFSTLDAPQRARLLSQIYSNMDEGSVFCTSIINPELLVDLPDSEEPEVEMEIEHPGTGHPLQISAEWNSDAEKFYLTWHYDHLLVDGQVERVSQSTEHFKVRAEAFIGEFVEIGFELKLIGDFEWNDFDDESQYLIIKAIK